MIVTCPRCFATYNVPDPLLGGQARRVRCSDCRFEWSESPPPQEAIAALAPEPQVSEPEPSLPPPAPVTQAEVPPPTPVRRGGRRSPPVKSGAGAGVWLGWTAFSLLVLGCFLVILRDPLGKQTPWLTDFYEMIGLPVEGPEQWFRFEDIALEKSEADGQTVLIVRGQVLNQSRRARTVPEIKLFWLEKGGQSGPVTLLQARPARIGPGEAARFSGDLSGVDASAGGEVKVTFTTPGEDTRRADLPVSSPAPVSSPSVAGSSHAPETPAHNNGH